MILEQSKAKLQEQASNESCGGAQLQRCSVAEELLSQAELMP